MDLTTAAICVMPFALSSAALFSVSFFIAFSLRLPFYGSDLGLFKSSNAALLAMKTFIDNHVRSASKISIELFTFSDDALNDDASLPYTTTDLMYNPSTKKYDDLNPVLFV